MTDAKTKKSARVKHIGNSWMVAHLWANQTQEWAATPYRNCSFDGAVLKSYATPIAMHVTNPAGETAVLISTHNYSSTTSGHQSAARQASRHLKQIRVECVGERYGSGSPISTDEINRSFANRIESRVDSVADAKNKISRANRYAELQRMVSEANEFCAFFGLPLYVTPPMEDMAEMIETAKIARKAKTARDKLRAAEVARQREETRDLWIARNPEATRVIYDAPLQYMRLSEDGAEIETSMGATVPTEHVRKAAPILLRMIRTGKAYFRSYNTPIFRFGVFTLDSVSADGIVKVGCHTFDRAEIERVADMLSIVPESEPDTKDVPFPDVSKFSNSEIEPE